ncbi:MAG TPA: tetratricopeptide repeat protein [Cytophagales bacterium]|nr:tetratricopeptide repeat protein [Cytophagales bacterium]
MSKYQIILVIVGIALIGWLYSLPKVVVKSNKQPESAKAPQASSSSHSSADSLKNIDFSEEASSKISDFRTQFNAASDKTTKIRIADSIATVFKENRSFDSAAYYKKIIAQLSPDKTNLENAGDAFADAANFSAEMDKVRANSEEARRYYEQILQSAPDDLNVKSKIAMTYISSENPMAGITMLREVVQKDPNNELAIFNLGILSLQSKQNDKAVERFEKLVDLNPNHWKGRFYLGIAYNELGKKKKAREQFELVKKLEQDPEVVQTVDNYLEEIR